MAQAQELIVIAFDDEGDVFEAQPASTMDAAQAIARELQRDYPYAVRICIYTLVEETRAMKEKLVIAFDAEGNALEARRAANARHARKVADDLLDEHPATKRVSICEEINFVIVGDHLEVVPMSP